MLPVNWHEGGGGGSPKTSSACLASQLILVPLLRQSLLRYCWAFLLPLPECLSQFRKFATSAINNKSQSRNSSSRSKSQQLSRLMNISWQNDFCRNPSIFTPRERLKRPKNVKARAPHRAYKSRRFYQLYGEPSALWLNIREFYWFSCNLRARNQENSFQQSFIALHGIDSYPNVHCQHCLWCKCCKSASRGNAL